MKPKHYILKIVVHFLSLFVIADNVSAQANEEQLAQMILKKDSLFWDSYNRCDTSNYNQFFSDDLEFYHDKGGIIHGVDGLALSMKKNLCSNADFRLRREVVKGTVKVFPLANSEKLYGAVLSGEHVFYILEKGKEPRLDGRARFTHLWLLKNNVWKMTRILSYDHRPAQ
jgi:Domain of unknown function (DUF4440)